MWFVLFCFCFFPFLQNRNMYNEYCYNEFSVMNGYSFSGSQFNALVSCCFFFFVYFFPNFYFAGYVIFCNLYVAFIVQIAFTIICPIWFVVYTLKSHPLMTHNARISFQPYILKIRYIFQLTKSKFFHSLLRLVIIGLIGATGHIERLIIRESYLRNICSKSCSDKCYCFLTPR